MSALPTIGFDTSGINALENGVKDSEALMMALKSGFDVRLLGLSADEVLSTPTKRNPDRREALLARCQRLLGSGQCLWPPHWILRTPMPEGFDWSCVDVRAVIFERAIIDRAFTDALCARQRKEQFEIEKSFEMWNDLRPTPEAILAEDPSKRPISYRQAVTIATMEGGVLWGFGGELYRYLPYCGRFVTDDWPQEKRLREVATEAHIDCEVLSFQQFDASFSVKVWHESDGWPNSQHIFLGSRTLTWRFGFRPSASAGRAAAAAAESACWD